MSFDEYQKETAKTWKFAAEGDEVASLTYLAMGLCGESGEVSEYLKKFLFHDKYEDLEPMVYELGDVLWYLARLAAVSGYSLQEVAEKNIEKLRLRHGS